MTHPWAIDPAEIPSVDGFGFAKGEDEDAADVNFLASSDAILAPLTLTFSNSASGTPRSVSERI
jgi:hypothetical protein